MKHEWRKHEKASYIPKESPKLIRVEEQKFFMIKGKGNPNDLEFSDKIGLLYSLAYGVRMMPKQGYTPEGYFEYTVYPLEGIWELSQKGKELDTLDKNELLYTIMIRQPDFVTEEVVARVFENISKKKPHPLLDEVSFSTMEDGLSVQILHLGSYDREDESFEKMDQFTMENKLERISLQHREIYLTDARKTLPEKLKTVLRYRVREKAEGN